MPYPHNRREYNGVSFVIGARHRIGFRYQKQSIVSLPFLNHMVLREQPQLHCVEENLRWAAALLDTEPNRLPAELIFGTSAASEAQAAAFRREHRLEQAQPLIGIHASCNTLKNQQNRCWPTDRYAELIQRLRRQHPKAQFILFEGPADAQVTGVICQQVPDVVVARRLPTAVVRALLGHCHLFVCNLSGLMHIAAAAKVPIVAVYGPTNPVWDYPWKCEHIIVNRHLPCSPCFYYGSRPLDCVAKLDYACVRELPVEDVEKAALQLLKRQKREGPGRLTDTHHSEKL
jgi:heptosyltransferase-2